MSALFGLKDKQGCLKALKSCIGKADEEFLYDTLQKVKS
jgi:hypothetical protein